MPPWPDEIAPHLLQFERFLAAHTPTFEATEATVYNRAQHYAGTLDAILTLADGRKLLVDYKSGKAVYPEVGLQLAAYRYAEFIGMPDNTEAPMQTVDGCAVLHLTPDAFTFQEVRADQDVFNAFLYARETFRFMEETSKTVLGELILPTATFTEVA